MAILTFPTSIRRPSAATIRAVAQSTTHSSPFDGSVQTLYQPGFRWAGTLTWSRIPIHEWRVLSAFINALHGRAGRFLYTHPLCDRRATASIGTPLVAGANQTGPWLDVDGFPSAVATVMKAGDWFSYEDSAGRARLHQVTSDIVTDSSGNATLAITPPLRAAPPDNAPLELSAPLAVWMLASDDQGEAAVNGADAYKGTITLEIEEALHGSGLPYTGGFILDTSELV